MLSIIWAVMILAGIMYSAVSSNLGAVGECVVGSSKEAVLLCITMLGIMSFWSGIMNVAKESGLIDSLTLRIRPFVVWLFPDIKDSKKAQEFITLNMIANMLGMGWAATPAGLIAMEELGRLNGNREEASDVMCAFLIINISSLQLIPVNIIAYRSQYGSVCPESIVFPALIATFISTLAAIIFCKIKMRGKTKKKISLARKDFSDFIEKYDDEIL